ncbi:MAG: 6,7-dimethyl-8-ribityllumazine synthase [Armatimonadetes bacterium]|nr:6,7-dimethyl-8-ribityllumazine synthase [Armatimonadota bacterium]MCX7969120.1 6,7-dimethyl-8-ribityllumazine synthase [Armatimonadota bacterium]MDW8142231.1 6,7-dimethyl-8-ribityllumazine synthase [Armatimonadota bacterium]
MMSKTFEGQLTARGLKFAIVVSRFNSLVTQRLLDGALDALRRHEADENAITIAWTPGSFEIPLVAQKFAKSGKYDAVICLGCIIRGDTPHFEYVASETAKGIAQVMLDTGVPVVFGVVTADNLEQALERAGAKAGNRGFDAAMTAIEMANLLRRIDSEG